MNKMFSLALMSAGVLAVTSCGKLGNLSADNFKVTPTPLEEIGGEVPATISGVFPEKYMKKKAVVTVTPVLKFEGKEVCGQSATFQGEKVQGNGTSIQYKVGGTYTMKAAFPYEAGMINSDLYARFDARMGSKVVSVPEVKIGYGVRSTSQLLAMCGTTASTASDAFQRVIEHKQEANIKFLINQANLRASEKKSVSISELVGILKDINAKSEERALQSIQVSAYASPDGSYSFNEKLAEKRQNVSADYLRGELKKLKMNADIDTKFTAEDWEGFQELISKSNLQDKDVILRVLSMYKDPEERERQIRNMSSVYTELADGIMPELRRARLIVNYEVIGRSDSQIVETMKNDPSKLSVEEMLRAANVLTKDDAVRKEWYKMIVKQYPEDCRAYNNLAQMSITEGNWAEAEKWLSQAKSKDTRSAETNANLALVALHKGDKGTAESYLAQASGANTFGEISGALSIAKGNYSQAQKSLSGSDSNTAALAQIMNKDYAAATRTLDNVAKPDGTTHYLKAIVAARTNNASAVTAELKSAVAKNPALAQRATKDIEFEQYASAVAAAVK